MDTPFHDLIEEYHSEDIMSVNHSRVINRLCIALNQYANLYDVLPELELKLNGKPVKPDISVFPVLTEDWDNDIIFFTQPPVIAIDIQSPKQATTDITSKMNDIYFPAGIQSVWIIIPPLRLVFIQTPDGKKVTFTQGIIHDPVTEISLPLESLFR